jgi:hypothetical protein
MQLKKSDKREIAIGLQCADWGGGGLRRVGWGTEREGDGFTCFDEGHVTARMLQARLNFVNCCEMNNGCKVVAIWGQDWIFRFVFPCSLSFSFSTLITHPIWTATLVYVALLWPYVRILFDTAQHASWRLACSLQSPPLPKAKNVRTYSLLPPSWVELYSSPDGRGR